MNCSSHRFVHHGVSRHRILFVALSACFGFTWAETPVVLDPVQVSAPAPGYSVRQTSAGTRVDTPVATVPQSVITVTRKLMDDQGAENLSEALRNVSNVTSLDPRDVNNAAFRIRGFGAAVVIDGVAMPGYFQGQEGTFNVERIDVLKGPSGALFGSSQGVGGAGTLGGTIAITTPGPQGQPLRRAGIKVGSRGEKGLSFDVNQPLSEHWAVRLAGDWSDSDSETNRVYFKRQSLFPSLSFTPNADTQVTLRLRSTRNKTLDYSGLPVTGTLDRSSFTLPRSTYIGSPDLPDSVQSSDGFNLQWAQRLSQDWSFNLLVAQNEAKIDQRGVWLVDSFNANGCLGFGTATVTTNTLCGARLWDRFRTTTISPALTAKLKAGAVTHTVTLGVDHEKTRDDAFMAYSNGFGPVSLANVNLTNPAYPAWAEPVAPSTPDQKNTYAATVLYAQDQIDWGRWHVLGSLRHSQIKIDDVNPAFGVNNQSTNRKITPRLGVVYDLSSVASLFVGRSEGIKIPVLSLFSAPPKPEESSQTEVGLRITEWSGVTATLAWFDLTRKNVVIADPSRPGFSIQAGQQRSRGIDADVHWQATPAWAWLLAFTAQQAEISQDTNQSLVDKQLFNVPERSARLATRYDVKGGRWHGLGLGLGLTYRSRLPINSANTRFTPSATVWDAQLSYVHDSARYSVGVVNLLDKKYFVPSNYFGGNQVIPAQRRALTVAAQFSF